MRLPGGTNTSIFTLAFIGWHWIIYPSQVRSQLPQLKKKTNNVWVFFSATSVDVERTFSQGRLLLSHIRNQLSIQSTRALLCLGVWSLMGYVKDADVKAATVLPEVGSDEEIELPLDWDAI
jgi:hypothetical protein